MKIKAPYWELYNQHANMKYGFTLEHQRGPDFDIVWIVHEMATEEFSDHMEAHIQNVSPEQLIPQEQIKNYMQNDSLRQETLDKFLLSEQSSKNNSATTDESLPGLLTISDSLS